MSKLTGPLIYLGGLVILLFLSALLIKNKAFYPLLFFATLYCMALNFIVSRRWPSSRFQQSRIDYKDSFIIAFSAFLLNEIIFNPSINWISSELSNKFLPTEYMEAVRIAPFWLQIFLALFVFEGLSYLTHRFTHWAGPLWQRAHSVHHEQTSFGVSLAFRFGYADHFFNNLVKVVFLQFFQVSQEAFLVIMVTGIYVSFMIHLNTSLKFGLINGLLNTSDSHIWHHDSERRVNYAGGLLMIFDKIGGTYYCPDTAPERVGIDGVTRARSAWETLSLRPLCRPGTDGAPAQDRLR